MMSNVLLLILLLCFPLPKKVAPLYIHTSYTLSVIYCTTKNYVAIIKPLLIQAHQLANYII